MTGGIWALLALAALTLLAVIVRHNARMHAGTLGYHRLLPGRREKRRIRRDSRRKGLGSRNPGL